MPAFFGYPLKIVNGALHEFGMKHEVNTIHLNEKCKANFFSSLHSFHCLAFPNETKSVLTAQNFAIVLGALCAYRRALTSSDGDAGAVMKGKQMHRILPKYLVLRPCRLAMFL